MKDWGLVQVAWEPRAEQAAETAERVHELLDDLAPFLAFIDAPLAILRDDNLDPDLGDLETVIVEGVRRDDRGEPWPERGSSITLFASDDTGSKLTLTVSAGATAPIKRVAYNTVSLTAEGAFPDDAFRAFAEANLLSVVDAFEPAFGWGAEGIHARVNARSPIRPRFGPVTWVSDRLGPLPAAIDGATQQRHGDGTLVRLAPEPGVSVWDDDAPTTRVLESLRDAGWDGSLTALG